MISTQRERATPTLLLVALAVVLVVGCNAQTEKNTGLALTSGNGSGSGGGTGSSGGTGPQLPAPPVANSWGLMNGGFNPTTFTVRGYAYNSAFSTLNVDIYIGGPMGTGTLVASAVPADYSYFLFPSGPYWLTTPGSNPKTNGYAVPAAYRDGVARQMWVYAIDPNSGVRNNIGGSPTAFWAGQNTAGRNYWNANVRALLTSRCANCHQHSFNSAPSQDEAYYVTKSMLFNPSKFKGGSATINELIGKGIGQYGHGGGNVCNGVNGSPCDTFQAWWNVEFGP
jgi:hypothetical protein